MNKANTELNKHGVFHVKNIEINEKIEFNNNKIFDHPILFGKAKFKTYFIKEQISIRVLDSDKIKDNNKVLFNIKNGQSDIGELRNPLKTISVKSYQQKIDLEKFGENYVNIKEEIKIKNREDWKIRYSELNTILTQNHLNNENWVKINKTLIRKNNSKIYKNNEKRAQLIKEFKDIFKHNETKNYDVNETLKAINDILICIKNNINNFIGNLFSPNSQALDFYGFSQRNLINMILDDDYKRVIDKFTTILVQLSNNNCVDILIHNFIKVVLIKKRMKSTIQKILDLYLYCLLGLLRSKKICKPLVDKLINNKITNSQFGFKKGSSCSIGKTMIYYKSKKFKFNKALLIDVRKAYDSVDRNILKECIENNFDEEKAAFLNNFIKLYDQLTMIINNSEIKATCGLPQTITLSPIFLTYI